MSINLIGKDVKLMRARYDEALEMQGIPAVYQYPLMADTNEQGESVIDSYSDKIDTHVFFEGNPKMKTIKRFGWVVENNRDLPFLIHCSFNLPHLQRDCIFRISGQYSELPDRVFRVTELAQDLQAPDHIACQIVPIYDEGHIAGRTRVEEAQIYSSSNTFLKPNVDYRGHQHTTSEEVEK